ncbi:hypothetical protein P7B04_07950 [Sphingobium yanoikuyae]|nr:hypothetical protein [Sphingobium yanoikuyae]
MGQKERMDCSNNAWEAAPWDASDEIADSQLKGFQQRSEWPIFWTSVRESSAELFGLDRQWFISRDVEYYAEHAGEQLLLMQLAWHGFPDPPEWRLASRSAGKIDVPWSEWGYFAKLPQAWIIP